MKLNTFANLCHYIALKNQITCFPYLKMFLICKIAAVLGTHCFALTALHGCVDVTTGRESEALASAAGARRSLQTSRRSTQTKRYSCNSGAAVQQSAGSVGGFNKKRVSLCALLDFGAAKGTSLRADDMQTKKKI